MTPVIEFTALEGALPEMAESTIKTIPQQEQVTRSSIIKTQSPALLKAKAAKKGTSAPAGKQLQRDFPYQKPPKSKFVRVHPSPNYHLLGLLTMEDKDMSVSYYLSPDLELPDFIESQARVTDVYAAQMHDGTFFVWPVNRSDTSWYRSAKTTIRTAMTQWIAVIAKKSGNIYKMVVPEEAIPEPEWSDLPLFIEMVESAFDGHMITDLDHPYLRKLRGCREDDDA